MKLSLFVGTLIAIAGFAHFAWSEPWVSNRFSQNCSSCHSPSRRNLPLKDRRCTLACQGCHVNPSGGGMRNEYGVWNQQRWLRSFASKTFRDKGTPAPLEFQIYGKQPKRIKTQGKLNTFDRFVRNGPKLVVTKDLEYNPRNHDKGDKQEFVTVRSEGEFLARVTEDDPWRLERRKSIFAGGDLRFFFIEQDGKILGTDIPESRKSMLAPMVADLYVKGRPIRDHLSLVVESRYFNNPVESEIERSVSSSSQVKSAYVLIDDLPYASYFQYGIMRPMFGHLSPDHESLMQELIHRRPDSSANRMDNSYEVVYKAFTIGASPNVPFFNFSLIQPMDNDSEQSRYRQEEGIAFNIGGRFVSYGASIMLSYWDTKVKDETGTYDDLERNMISLAGGAYLFDRLVLNVDYSQIDIEFAPGSSNTGQVYTAEAKYRMWRENYLALNYAQASTSRRLLDGDSADLGIGYKGFLLAGMEFELMFIQREDRETGTISKRDIMQSQLHFFF